MFRQHGAVREKQGAFDHVLQLADVPRPAVGPQTPQGLGGDRCGRSREVLPRPLDERRDELRKIFDTLPERRDLQSHPLQAVEQIEAELAGGDELVEIAVRRSDDAHIDIDRAVAAHALDLPLLERSQNLGLHRERHIADLVEKERAAVRGLEPAAPGPDGPGKSAPFMAEQLGLQQPLRNGGAIDGDQRSVFSHARSVNRLRQQILAGAALAFDQYRDIRARHPLHGVQHTNERIASSDEAFEASRLRRLERGDLLLQAPTLERTRHDDLQLNHVERFGEEVVRATAQRVGGCLPDTEAGHGNDRDVRRQLPARPDRIEPVAVGKLEIE